MGGSNFKKNVRLKLELLTIAGNSCIFDIEDIFFFQFYNFLLESYFYPRSSRVQKEDDLKRKFSVDPFSKHNSKLRAYSIKVRHFVETHITLEKVLGWS